MPPKNRFTRDQIIHAALDITRARGFSAVTARAVAEKLGASPKVIFGLFPDMAALKAGVLAAADEIYQRCLSAAMAAGEFPPYKASGLAYIDFARREKMLFQLLFMRDRTGEPLEKETESLRPVLAAIRHSTGMSEEEAFHFHLEMWVCVHGIATMIATGFLEWDARDVSNMVTDIYQAALSRRARQEKE